MLTSSELVHIQSILKSPKLHFFESEEWGSQNQGHREKIRESLFQFLSRYPIEESHREAVRDLSAPPFFSDYSISISHMKGRGAYVCADSPPRLGFDLESRDRPRKEIVARIASQSEMSHAPHFSLLWSAKEAAYKSLYQYNQPRAFSDLEIVDWQSVDEFYTFSLNRINCFNIGVVLEKKGLIYSFFSLSP